MTELMAEVTPAVRSASVATTASVITPSVIAYSAIVCPLSGQDRTPMSSISDPLSRIRVGSVGRRDDPPLWESSAVPRRRPMAIESKTFTYAAELEWRGGRRAAVTAGQRPPLEVVPPPDFPSGDDTNWSPEHLFLASLQSCTMLS